MYNFLGLWGWFICSVLIVNTSWGQITQQPNVDTLQLVQVIFRHGERVPEYPYPTDPYNKETQWKEGWAQLTDVGKKQVYQLGQYLRSRYQNFVSDSFVPKEIYTLSSDTDRTIMSAQLCLAGMFPTENGTSWNPDLKWQPIPIRTVAEVHDNMLRCKRKCPRFERELKNELYNSAELSKINSDNKDLFEFLSTNSGVNITNINEIDDFYSTMMVEEMLGLSIPKWAESVIHTENFQYMYNRSFSIKSSTLELKRLRTGPLLEDINSHFHERITNSSSKTKFYMYSAHDTTLVNVLNTLDILDLQRPAYASVILMELHRNPQTNNYFVNVLFRNDTTMEPYKRTLPVCEFDCPYEEFVQFILPMIPENWDKECERQSASTSWLSPIVYYVIGGIVGLLLLIGLVFLLSKVLCRKNKTKDPAEYERI